MSVSPVDTASPPITARARGALASLPTSTPRAMGKRPTRGGEAGHDDGAQARPAGPDHRLVEAQAVASQLVRVLDQEDPVGHETGRMAVNTGSLYGPWAWSQASAPYSGSAPNAVCYALVDTRESVEGDVHAVGDASPQGRPLVGARAAGAARALPVARGRCGDRDAGRDVLARRP